MRLSKLIELQNEMVRKSKKKKEKESHFKIDFASKIEYVKPSQCYEIQRSIFLSPCS